MASEHYKQAVTYRFTIIGVVGAAVAFLLGKDGGRWLGCFGSLMVAAVWMIEFRNRTILLAISKRMIEIEKEWGADSTRSHFMTYYHGQDFDFTATAVHVKGTLNLPTEQPPGPPTATDECLPWLFRRSWRFRWLRPSHTFGIDLLLATLLAACILRFTIPELFIGSTASQESQIRTEPLRVEPLKVDPLKVEIQTRPPTASAAQGKRSKASNN